MPSTPPRVVRVTLFLLKGRSYLSIIVKKENQEKSSKLIIISFFGGAFSLIKVFEGPKKTLKNLSLIGLL